MINFPINDNPIFQFFNLKVKYRISNVEVWVTIKSIG
jgi:hypothetical protein